MDSFSEHDKPDLEYPCSWEYRVIGTDADEMRRAVAEVVTQSDYELAASNTSRGGKYCSLRLSMTVTDEEHRVGIYHALREHEAIMMVM